MALRKPLVLISGQLQQLPNGDTLDAPASEVDVIGLSNSATSAQPICTPVYISGSLAFQPARANAAATVEVIGLIKDPSIAANASGYVQTDGYLTATAAQWDAVTGQTGGLTVGALYYLSSAAAGRLTTTAPTAGGEYVLTVGRAISAQTLEISIRPSILL